MTGVQTCALPIWISVGSAEIVCMAADGSEVTDKCTVTVRAKVKGVKLDQSNLQLAVGNGDEAATGHIGFAIQPEDAYIQTVTWMSSDEWFLPLSCWWSPSPSTSDRSDTIS